jgi:hypothetical protein
MLSLLLFCAHESSMVLYALAALLFLARTPRRLRPMALALAPVLLAGALAVVYHVRSAGLKAPSVLAASPIPVSSWQRVVDLPSSLYSVGDWSPAILVMSLLAVALLGARAGRVDLGASRPADVPWRFVVLGVVCLAGYFLAPEAFVGSTLIHQRFLPPALAALVTATLSRRTAPPGTASLAALVPVAMLAASLHFFIEADRSYRDLDEVLAHMEDGSATAQLDLSPRSPSVVAPVVGAAARALALHGGRLLFSFTDAPTYPLLMPPTRRWDEPVKRMVMTPFAFAPTYDLTRFRYVLVWAPATRIRDVLDEAFAPEAHRKAAAGSWVLFESTLALASVVADDQPLPSPAPTPLATRVKSLLAARGEL